MEVVQNGDASRYDGHQKLFRRIAIHLSEPSPTGTFRFSYMTEGAANTIWLIHFNDSNLSHHDSSLVLRMRKDVPSTTMTALRKQYEEQIAPLFSFNPGLLLPVQLVQIDADVVSDLNNQLRRLEYNDQRKQLRVGVYHPSIDAEPYAMILPNLAHAVDSVVEFKPKWLVQSPSAPRDAQRCRTCALNTMRRALGSSGRGDGGFCPFDLLSSHDSILIAALRQLWQDETTLSDFMLAFKNRVQPALRQLQTIQRSQNAVGLKDFLEPEGKDFGVAMALRDCSVVLQIGRPSDGHRKDLDILLVKLLDLDLKLANSVKLKKWANTEIQLVEGGWYTSAKASEVKCAMTFQEP